MCFAESGWFWAALGLSLFVAFSVWLDWKWRRFVGCRAGLFDSIYERHFAATPDLLEIALAVREAVREMTSTTDLVVLPADEFYRTYFMADEDVEDAMLELLQRFGRKALPSRAELEGYPPVITVEDMVRFVVRFRLPSDTPCL